MIVVDSDILIDALRGREPARSRLALEITAGRIATTTVSAYELLSGARTEAEEGKVNALLSALTLLPLDEASSRRAAKVHRDLARSGARIGNADCLIAGICLARDGLLLTRNRDQFERVPGLKLGTLLP